MLKVFADLACWAPVVITLNLVSVSLLTGHTFDSALLTAQGNLPHLWGLEGVIFTPYNVCQFSLIPPENATGNFTKIVQRVPVRISIEAGPEARRVLRPGLSVEVTVDTISAKGSRDRIEQETERLKHDETQGGR